MPAADRCLFGVVIREIVFRYLRIKAPLFVTFVLKGKTIYIILRMTVNKNVAAAVRDYICACSVR